MWFAQLVLMFGGSWLQSSALAQYQDGEVLVANFQSYIKRSFPTGVTFPNDDRWETWAETLIAKTAIDSLLRNHEETLQCVNQQDEKATNLWTVARQLAADVEQSYADELVISPLALKRSRQKLGDRDNHALVLFRSIFLKTTGKDTESIERAHLRMAAIRNQL